MRDLCLALVVTGAFAACKTPGSDPGSKVMLSETADTVTGIDQDATLSITWDFLTPGSLTDGVGDDLEFFLRVRVCNGEPKQPRCAPVNLARGGTGQGIVADGSSTPTFAVKAAKNVVARPKMVFGTTGLHLNKAAGQLPKSAPGSYWLALDLHEDDSLLSGANDFVGWTWAELGDLDVDTTLVISDPRTGAKAGVKIDARDGLAGKQAVDFGQLNFNYVPIEHIRELVKNDYLCAVTNRPGDLAPCLPKEVPIRGKSPSLGELAYLMPFGDHWLVFARQEDPKTRHVYYKVISQQPMTLAPQAVADALIFGAKEQAAANQKVLVLTVVLHALPGGAAADHFAEDGVYSGEAWLSVAGDLGMVLTGGATKAIKVTGIVLQSGVVAVRGYQVVRAVGEGDWVRAAANSAEILLRVGNVASTVRALRAGIPQAQVLAAATKVAEPAQAGGSVVRTAGGSSVRVAGKQGPGISDDILDGAQKLANEVDHPVVLYGSRQTGISEKSGKLFRPDSDVDLGVLKIDHLLGEIVDPAFVQRFHRLFEHGPSAIFDSAEAAVKKGYLVVYPLKG